VGQLQQANNESSFDVLSSEAMNCILECMSLECYRQVHNGEESSSPLEPGEIDLVRATEFEICVQEQVKETRRKERGEMRQKRVGTEEEQDEEERLFWKDLTH
jgi:hypothetical protein